MLKYKIPQIVTLTQNSFFSDLQSCMLNPPGLSGEPVWGKCGENSSKRKS